MIYFFTSQEDQPKTKSFWIGSDRVVSVWYYFILEPHQEDFIKKLYRYKKMILLGNTLKVCSFL